MNLNLVHLLQPPASAEEGSSLLGNASGGSLLDLLERAVQIGLSMVQAALILFVGWLLARLVRSIVVRTLRRLKVGKHLAVLLTGGRRRSLEVEPAIGTSVYALVMLFVAIEALQALGLTLVARPLADLAASILGFIPNLLAASVLAVVTWCVASLARNLGLQLFESFEIDRRWSEVTENSPETPFPGASLPGLLADGLFYFVVLFLLPQIFDALGIEGLGPVRDVVHQVLGTIPNFLGAAFVFGMFYLVAKIVQRLVVRLLASFGFDQAPRAFGWTGATGPRASVVAGWIVLGSLLSTGLMQACNTLGLVVVAELLGGLLQVASQIFLALLVLALGMYGSRLAFQALAAWEGPRGDGTTPLASSARNGILFLSGAMALSQAGVAPEIIQMAVGATCLAAAIAGGLAFGLGGRDSAARWLESRRS